MERKAEPLPAASLWREVRLVLISAPFLVGTAILVGSVLVGGARDEPGILLLGFIGYLVAGLLAPRRPWATGMLLGLVHAAAALALLLLTVPAPGDGWAHMGIRLFMLLLALCTPVGMAVTGLVGRLVLRWLRTEAR